MTTFSNSFRLHLALSRCLPAFAAFLLAGFASAQVVTNGDFEDATIGSPYISTNPSTVPGWARFGSTGDGLLVRIGYSDPDGSVTTAGHGNQFAILGGGQNGAASASWRNTVTGLTPNTSYTLSFMIANEGEALSQSITVSFPVGSSTGAQTFSTSTGAFQNYWRSWESKTMVFTTAANSTAVTIDFSVNQRFDIGLDYVRVTPRGGGGVTVDFQSVLKQVNPAAATYSAIGPLVSQGLTITANLQGQVPSGAPLGAGTMLINPVGTNQVNPAGTASVAQFFGPNFTPNALTCVTLAWTGTGSLTSFSATRIGVSGGGSVPAWAIYAYSASGTLLDTKGEGNITTGSFSQPSTFATFTLSSSTSNPIANVVFCSHNGASTYGAIPFSGGSSLGNGGGGGGSTVSAIPGTANILGTADIFAAGRTFVPNFTGGGGTLPPAFTIPSGSAGKAITVTNVSGFMISCAACTTQITPDGTNMPTNIDPTIDSGQQAQFQIGISGIQHDTTGGFLAGVFTGDQVPAQPPPAKRNVTSETSTASIAPLLNQTFFIGDGLTGTGTGAVQQFIIPQGATTFYLGFADANFFQGYPGYYGDNSGQETATVDIVTATSGGSGGGAGGSVTVDVSPRFTNDPPPYPAVCSPTPRSNTFASTDAKPQLVFRVTGLRVGQDVVATVFIGPDGQPVAGLGGNFGGPAKFNPDCFNDGTFNPATAASGNWTVKATLNGSTQLFSLPFTVTGTGGGGGGTTGGACRVDITSAKGANYNLTTEGTADWYFMGQFNVPTGCQTGGEISGSPTCTPALRKSGGSLLSNLTFYSSVPNNTGYVHLVGDSRQASWSDGAPTQSGTTSGAIMIEHGGIKFTAPADQQQRTLMLHVGGYPRDASANLTLTAHIDGLQDQPMTQVIDQSPNANDDVDFKIVYQAPQSGQITVSLQVNHSGDETLFQAVALSQPVQGSSCSGSASGGGGTGGGGTGGGGGTVTVSSPPKQFPPAGGTGTVTATPPAPGTTVTATPSVPWIIIIDISGGTITYSVPPNTGDARVGTISIAAAGAIPAIVPVSQNAPNAGTGTGGCTYPLQSITVQGFDMNGNSSAGSSTGLIRFLTASTCSWTATILYAGTSTDWITIQSPGSSGVGNGAISFNLTPNTTGATRVGAIVLQGQVTLITQDAGPPAGTPVISSGGIVNAASYASGGPPNGLAQGSFFSMFGSSLGPDQFLQAGYPIPDTLGGVSVQIVSGGSTYRAPLVFVSAGQINGLIPSNVPVGPAQVMVTYNGKSSALAGIVISKTSFGVFFQAVNGNNVALAQNVRTSTDYPLNVPIAPAKPGQIVIIWGTGLFPINGPDNVAPGANARDLTGVPVTIAVGGLPAQRLYAGRQAEAAGVDNIYFTLPANVQLGCNVPVTITVNGVAANTTTIAISADGSPCSSTPSNTNTQNTTLTVTGSGTVSSSNVSATGTVTLSGVGTGTFTSSFTLASAAVSGSAPITLNITSGTRTGSLTATLTGSLTLLSQVFAGDPNSSGPATATVTSGTGGFAGATGTFGVTAAGTGRGTSGSGAGTFSINGPGTLTIP